MTATNNSAPRMPRSMWTTVSRMKKTTIPPMTTAPILAQFITRPLSVRADSIIVVLAADRAGGEAESGKTQGKPWADRELAGGRMDMQALGNDIGGAGGKGGPGDHGRAGRPSHREAARRPEEDRHPVPVHARRRRGGGARARAGVQLDG